VKLTARHRRAIELVRKLRGAQRGYVPHTPHPKQAEFLSLTTLEALYGGAAGGGKSDALLMGALQYVHVPGYAALLLRRTFRDLNQPDAIMARSHEWLRGTDARWNDRDKRWTFPSGATLTFGYLDTDKDKYQYAGAALQFIGWDEETQFAEAWYTWMFSRLRKLHGSEVPLRVRGATNPGGVGHEWVRRRFIAKPDPSRPFVPALLVDNPSVDADSYRLSLAQLDHTTRQQLEHGVWVRDAGGLVYAGFDETRNVIDAAPKCDVHLLGMDYAFTDDCAFTVLGWRKNDPNVYVLESYRKSNMLAPDAAEEAKQLEAKYKFTRIVGDPAAKGYIEEARRRFAIPVENAEKTNKRGYQMLINGELERGTVKVVRATCPHLIEEWSTLPWADEGREKEADGFDNHCSDATLYVWRCANAFLERVPPPAVPEGTAEYWEKREKEMERAAVRAFRQRR
jgi:hypothetical protein